MSNYYKTNSKEFIDGTINCDMSFQYNFFEKHLDEDAKTILDIGFGSGRDSLYFSKNYEVYSIDPVEEFCKYAKELGLENVYCKKVEDIEYDNMFDGIWACASLLHIPFNELNNAFKKCYKALKNNGIMYCSFKYGTYEGERAGRFFTDLNEELFKKNIWKHRPITDIWNISNGIANRLLKYNVYDLYGVTLLDESILYKEFGINAELLIDHANGIEPCTISDIKAYKSKSNSLSNGQILDEDYIYKDAYLVMKEMVDLISLELIEKGLCTNHISLYVGYSKDIIKASSTSVKLKEYTNSRRKLIEYFKDLFERSVNREHFIRRINIGLGNLKDESFVSFTLFDNEEENEKEKNLQKTLLNIKARYGKNSILKAMNLDSKATTIKRNKLIGGHNSGEDD